MNTRKAGSFAALRLPFYVASLAKGSGGEKAGLQKGDRIIGVDSVATPYYNEFTELMKGKKDETVNIRVLRQNDTLSLPVKLEEGKIGAYAQGDIDSLANNVIS